MPMRNSGSGDLHFQGLGVALVTPFSDDLSIDVERFRKHIEFQIENGVQLLIPAGTTGESVTMSTEEQLLVIQEAVNIANGRAKILAGIGGNNTSEVIGRAQRASELGIDGILSSSPAYNKPTQEGLFQHFKVISESTSLPGILYNVPGRTSLNMTADTTLRLAQIDNIVGVKEASSDFPQITEIIDQSPDNFMVWSGNDDETFQIMCVGGFGIVSVASNIIGLQIKKMMELILQQNISSAAIEHRRLLPIFKALFWVTNPIPIKYAVNKSGFRAGSPRLPMWPADAGFTSKFDSIIDQYDIDLPV